MLDPYRYLILDSIPRLFLHALIFLIVEYVFLFQAHGDGWVELLPVSVS